MMVLQLLCGSGACPGPKGSSTKVPVGSQPIMPTRLASHSIVVLRQLRIRICPHAGCCVSLTFELERSQQATDRDDLVAHSGQLSF